MPIWELSPANNEKIVISLDADTREAATTKAEEMYPQYKRWICKKGGSSDMEKRETKVETPKKEIKEGGRIKPKAVKKKETEIIVLDM